MSASYASQAHESDFIASSTVWGSRAGGVGEFKIEPLKAFRAFQKLVENKEDTIQVFEIVRALTGKSFPEGYKRLIATEEGGRQSYERVELAEKFVDQDWLDSFPEGTVGRAYRDFLAAKQFVADGLADESRKLGENVDARHPVAWYARRLRDVHDVWHVLTGYGTDALGEASLLGFTYAQTRNPGLGAIALGAMGEFAKSGIDQPYTKSIWQGYLNGRKAKWLAMEDYPTLFAEPLEVARKRLNIAPPTVYDRVPPETRNANIVVPMM